MISSARVRVSWGSTWLGDVEQNTVPRLVVAARYVQ